MMGILTYWKDLSVSKKLYTVVGIMAILIGMELLTLLFAMNSLSAMRALVGAEASWSKAQKDGIYNLEHYVLNADQRYYDLFLENIKIPLGDRSARLELEKEKNMDLAEAMKGLITGGNHPDDIVPMVKLIHRFRNVSYLNQAMQAWREGDLMMEELLELGEKVHSLVSQKKSPDSEKKVKDLLDKVYFLNENLTILETTFSSILGKASRELELVLSYLLILAVITVECTGLSLTIIFSKNLHKQLKELNLAAQTVGQGHFSHRVPIHGKDEVGQLAHSINAMADNIQQLVSDRNNAEHASQIKNLFLANMSHEIRTPLNSILGFSELLRDPTLSPNDQRLYFDIIKRTGNNLATIINDILDLSKVEAEQLEIEKEVFSLNQVLVDLRLLAEMRCSEKGISFNMMAEGEISEFIECDPIRLRQVILNIVGNAIKFTEKGSVLVKYQVVDNHLLFTVKDSGKGISESLVPNLFKPFSQGDFSIRKKFGGTGLGLVLSKKLAQLLGGDVGLLESQMGQGSVFYIKIGYKPAAMPDGHTQETSLAEQTLLPCTKALSGKTALVFEDTPENQILLELYLKKVGVKADFVANGLEGVKRASNNSYDIVLMDMQMPVMDGYEATKQLRAQGHRFPIIALTGYAMKGDREKCLAAGCNDYVSKPINYVQLVNTLALLFQS